MISNIIQMSVQNLARPLRSPRLWEVNTKTLTQYLFFYPEKTFLNRAQEDTDLQILVKYSLKSVQRLRLFSSLEIEGVVQSSIL